MELLSPEKIKDEKKVSTEEARRLVSGLGKEESDLVLRVNLLRNDEEDYLARKAARESEPADPAAVSAKTTLQLEVDLLERRKAAALEPITIVVREANALQANAEQAMLMATQLGEALEGDKKLLVARETAVEAVEQAQLATGASLDARTRVIVEREEKTLQRRANLDADIAAHLEQVAKDAAELTRREQAIQADARTNSEVQKDLTETARKQAEKDTEIADRYKQLEKTEKQVASKPS